MDVGPALVRRSGEVSDRREPRAWWNGPVTWLFVLLAIAVIAGGTLAAVGRLGELPEAEPDLRPEVRDGEPAFDVVVRGYRMDEVDARIASMQDEIDRLSGREG